MRSHVKKLLDDLAREELAFADLITSLQEENVRLRQELARRQDPMTGLDGEAMTDSTGHRGELDRLASACATAEQQLTELASLFATLHRLHSTLDTGEVLTAIQEVLVGFLGAEHHGVFLSTQGCGTLNLVAHMGIDPDRFRSVPVGSGLVGEVMSTGQSYFAPELETGDVDGSTGSPLVCIPLRAAGSIRGVISIFRFVPHKTGLLSADRELLSLLTTHAALALYASHLHGAVGSMPV
ncbi:MAG: GAF domain-containing protein [Candidatus Riflebacteria bacterium]|nr:GAF domain-containing protein [Candidatus Riflebacteria bacterium]